MHLTSKYNRVVHFILSVIDIFSKHLWFVSFEGKTGIKTANVFKKVLDKSGSKPNKIWIAKGNGFYNRSMKSRSQDNDILQAYDWSIKKWVHQ